MTGHMRGEVRYPLSEKARERYRYDLARARAGDPVAPAETPAQQAEQAERERAAKAKRERAAKARAKARRAAKAKRERAAKKRAAEKRAAEKRAAEKAKQAAKAKQAKQPTERLERKLVKAGLARLREKFPEKYSKGISKKESPALLIKRMKPDWANTCKAEGVSLDDYPLSDSWWDTVARAIGRRKDPRRR
jgi:DNA polymerase III gamma/tau subunit